MARKTCTKCLQKKSLTQFSMDRRLKAPHRRSVCKECDKERVKRYRKTRRPKKASYVYFVLGGASCKIGMTSAKLEDRLRKMQGQSPLPLTLIGFIRVTSSSARNIENNLHKENLHRHLWGEWFVYSPEWWEQMKNNYDITEANIQAYPSGVNGYDLFEI